ncbi:MAG: pyridoxal phosphate-dependent aminotransferase [bacterium]
MSISRRVKEIPPSPTLAITVKAAQMGKEGIDVIGFGAGEPDFDTPENVKEAAIASIREGFTKYTPASGIAELKEAICRKFKRDNDLDYVPQEVSVACGGKHSLFNIIFALCDEGDEVIIPIPYWVSYPEQVRLSGGEPVFVETLQEDDFRIKIEQLEAVITSKTKIIILNSPQNPTGVVYDREDLEAIAALAVRNNIYLISDEVYEKVIYDDRKHWSVAALSPEAKALTLTVNAVSKPYSMTGWRIGYAAGPKEIIGAMDNIQSHTTSNPTSISQKAAVEALNGPQDVVDKMVAEFDRRRKYMVDRLNKMRGVSCFNPGGAFYVFPNISGLYGLKYQGATITGSLSLTDFLLSKAKVAVVPGNGFGADDYIRLSYATSFENIQKGLDRIEEAIAKLEG